MSEMTAKEYARQFNRMCNSYFTDATKTVTTCEMCPFYDLWFGDCDIALTDDTDKAIELVSKWAEEHPERTYLTDFLNHFPKARLQVLGMVLICRKHVYGGDMCPEGLNVGNCVGCWKEIMPEVQE